MLLISLLSFYLKNSSQHFLQDRSSGDKLPQLCLGKSFPLLHLWRTTLPYWVFSFGSFILPALREYHLSLSRPAWFLLRNPLIVLWGFLYKLQAFFFTPFNIFCLKKKLTVDNFTVICPGEDLIKLFGNLWASWTWIAKSLSRFREFLAIIFFR